MKVDTHTNIRKAGFSLVEMLVVITVIGVIAAIAVPNIGRLTDAAEISKDQRNAQNLSSVCSAAQAAGLDFVVTGDLKATVNATVAGSTVTGGAFDGEFFGVPNMDDIGKTAAVTYLQLANGVLDYDPAGGTTGVTFP